MKLSEQITNSCCGVLADKQDMVVKALQLEAIARGFIKQDRTYVTDLTGYGAPILNRLLGVDDEQT